MIAPDKRPYDINPKSGRPETPSSWAIERVWNGFLVFMSIAASAAFAFALSSAKLGQACAFFAFGVLFMAVAYFNIRSLKQRQRDLSAAEHAYREKLAKHFDGS